MENWTKAKKAGPYQEIVIVILCVIIFLMIVAAQETSSIPHIISKIVNCFYTPNYNLVLVGQISYININKILLFIIIFSLIIVKRYRRINEKARAINKRSTYKAGFLVSMTVLIIIWSIQTVNYIRYFRVQFKANKNKTIEEKKSIIYEDYYRFSEFCKKHLPGRHKGRLITDMDLYSATGVHDHIALAYNLFPITIQYNPWLRRIAPYYVVDSPESDLDDVLIVYQKEKPEDAVPQDFEIVAQYDAKSILAIRKE